MIKAGFVGFGEVNTPKEIIVKKCAAAHDLLHTQGIDTVSVYPVTDDYEERDIAHALDVLGSEDFENADVLFLYSTLILNQSESMK